MSYLNVFFIVIIDEVEKNVFFFFEKFVKS